MNEQPVKVDRVSWEDLCPWMIIFRTLPVATSATVLILAILGVVLTPVGWLVSESLFINDTLRDNDPFLAEMAEINRSPYSGLLQAADQQDNYIEILGARISGPRLVFQRIVQPFYSIFGGSTSIREFFYFLLGSLWSMLVWSFMGVGITRVCLLRLTRDERAGLDDAFEFSVGNFITALLAISLPMLAVLLLCIPTFFLGLLLDFDFGTLVVGALWFVVLGISTVMAILLLGLLFGWPLMISSVACEGQNSFDAMTRAFAYTFQRPLNYFMYMLVAVLFGGFCWLIAFQVTEGIVDLGYWSTSWGANRISANRIELVEYGIPASGAFSKRESAAVIAGDTQAGTNLGGSEASVTSVESGTLQMGRTFIGFWNGLIRTVCVAFIYGLFWCMASAIYLLLRKDVDDTEIDEIHVLDERRTYELPPLKSDSFGIPQVQPLDSGPEPPDPEDSDVG